MIKDVPYIQERLQAMLKAHVPPLQVRVHTENNFEVAGTKPAMQGRKKVDGFYFASIVPKPKDVRLYFFPIYTHPDQFPPLSETLQKYLKGKSCFHVRALSPELEEEIAAMIARGVLTYKEAELV